MTLLSVQRSASTCGRRTAPSIIQVSVVLIARVIAAVKRFGQRTLTAPHRRPDVRGAHAYAFARLQADLPPILHYHALRHTRDDVLPAVERLAALSGITGHPLDLLRTAAVFHDIGYAVTRTDHEAASIAIVRTVLPGYAFSDEDIEQIVGMIAATKLPQTPRTPLEAMLADADLDSLGRCDYFERSEELRAECAACGEPTDQRTWCEQQHSFLTSHSYHTSTAHHLRDAQKTRNIHDLAKRIT